MCYIVFKSTTRFDHSPSSPPEKLVGIWPTSTDGIWLFVFEVWGQIFFLYKGPKVGGPEVGGGAKGGGLKFRAFFHLPPQISLILLSLGLLAEFWPQFKAVAHPKIRVWVFSGRKPWRPLGRRGSEEEVTRKKKNKGQKKGRKGKSKKRKRTERQTKWRRKKKKKKEGRKSATSTWRGTNFLPRKE